MMKSTVWIGNIDPKATEAQVLKLVKPFGKVIKFDFIYALKDPSSSERVPKGYAFVTYDNYVSADSAIRGLNGLQVLSKTLKVQPASSSASSSLKQKASLPTSLSMSLSAKLPSASDSISKDSKIKAMEAKLKALESASSSEFKVVPTLMPTASRSKPYDKTNRSHSSKSNKS